MLILVLIFFVFVLVFLCFVVFVFVLVFLCFVVFIVRMLDVCLFFGVFYKSFNESEYCRFLFFRKIIEDFKGLFSSLSSLFLVFIVGMLHVIVFIVDESFVDFASVEGQYSLLSNQLLSDNPHLVVVKSISKSYGVPGFRLGILASGNTTLIEKIKKEVAIWNINSFGEFYMQIYEKYHANYVKACEAFRRERQLFLEELREVPYLKIYDSQANYFLCRVTDRFTSHQLAIQLLKHNILIKDCATKKAFRGEDYIRLAVRDRKDNHLLTETLKSL